MNCWEALYIQTFHQQKVLITKEQDSDINSLFVLAKITNSPTQTVVSPHTSLYWKQRTHKYTVSTSHNLLLIFRYFNYEYNCVKYNY